MWYFIYQNEEASLGGQEVKTKQRSGLWFEIKEVGLGFGGMVVLTYILSPGYTTHAALSCIVAIIGGVLNLYVQKRNSGLMPVYITSDKWRKEVAGSEKHCFLTPETRLILLCDLLVLPSLIGMSKNSIGDLFIFLGLVMLLYFVGWKAVFPFILEIPAHLF